MNENPETTGCDGAAIRPIRATIGDPVPAQMTERTPSVYGPAGAGKVVAAFAVSFYPGRMPEHLTSTTVYDSWSVEIWCQSPTGGGSDSAIFHLKCDTGPQAEMIAAIWRDIWRIPSHGSSGFGADAITLDLDGIPVGRIDDPCRGMPVV
jgi:hypothetical protein